jgi:hypothetical protein
MNQTGCGRFRSTNDYYWTAFHHHHHAVVVVVVNLLSEQAAAFKQIPTPKRSLPRVRIIYLFKISSSTQPILTSSGVLESSQ